MLCRGMSKEPWEPRTGTINLPGCRVSRRAFQPRLKGFPCLHTGWSRAQGGGTNEPWSHLSPQESESQTQAREAAWLTSPHQPDAHPGQGPTSLEAWPHLRAEPPACSLPGKVGLCAWCLGWGLGRILSSPGPTLVSGLSPCHRLVGACGVQGLRGHVPLPPPPSSLLPHISKAMTCGAWVSSVVGL